MKLTGGFVVSNYPDADAVDARAGAMLSFFDLDEPVKRAVATRVTNPHNANIYRGYVASLEPGSWAHNETFDIGPETPVAGPPIAGMEILAEPNVWPREEPVAGWRETMQAYYEHMHRLGTAIMLSVGRGAGFTNEEIAERFAGGNSTLRLINYPRPDRPANVINELPEDKGPGVPDPPLAAGRHTDGSGVSLLWQRQPGLQAQAPDGTWRDVPATENCVSVHLGDVLEIMTDGKVSATPHRVIDHGTARQSVGFFLEPALNAELAPLSEEAARTDKGRRWQGTYGWALLERISGYGGYGDFVPNPNRQVPAGAGEPRT